jgi:hypothetical protein
LALLAPPIRSSPPATDGRPIRRLSQSEMEERRRLGLCFNCNEKFARGHNRVCQRIFLLDLADDDEEAATDDEPHQSPLISLLAMAGVRTRETMQVHIQLGGNRLLALLDSGSTHNFVSSETTGRTSLKLNPRGNMNVTMENGEKVPCPGVYRNVPFTIDGESFTTNFFALPLVGYDVVLRTEWLASLGPILWDFSALTMSFWHHDHRVCWTGVAGSWAPSVRVCSSDDLFPALLEEFTPVFAEPSGMTPPRHRDHCINLLPGSAPVAVRLYRYPAAHKDELERQCATMLSQGIIQHNSSAFSSPALLVKKADGSWHFCIDYRALNAITVKDAYPIPVVDELLDELHGARYFTKLDLRSGY